MNETYSDKRRLEVSNFIRHPKYCLCSKSKSCSEAVFIHDLGIIFLKNKLTYSLVVQPVKLVSDPAKIIGNLLGYHNRTTESNFFLENTPAGFFGWGDVFEGRNTFQLKKAKLNLIKGESVSTITPQMIKNCSEILKYEFIGATLGRFTNLCTVSQFWQFEYLTTKSFSKGDSGGPVMLNEREQIALLSRGPPCNKLTDKPQILVSIPHHYSWVASIIQSDGSDFRSNIGSMNLKPSRIFISSCFIFFNVNIK